MNNGGVISLWKLKPILASTLLLGGTILLPHHRRTVASYSTACGVCSSPKCSLWRVYEPVMGAPAGVKKRKKTHTHTRMAPPTGKRFCSCYETHLFSSLRAGIHFWHNKHGETTPKGTVQLHPAATRHRSSPTLAVAAWRWIPLPVPGAIAVCKTVLESCGCGAAESELRARVAARCDSRAGGGGRPRYAQRCCRGEDRGAWWREGEGGEPNQSTCGHDVHRCFAAAVEFGRL